MVLESEEPPQTVRQAIGGGWTALTVVCPPCKRASCPRDARILFKDLVEQGRENLRLSQVYEKAICRQCRRRPKGAKLAWCKDWGQLDSWHERDVLIVDGYVVRPGRW
ncbi:hypothetical protein LMIY3S_00268 [Labrys miyagiensis]